MLPLLGALATSAAVFSVLMAIFLPAIAVPSVWMPFAPRRCRANGTRSS